MADLKPLLTKKKVLKCNITQFKGKVNANIDQAEIVELKLFETKLNAFSDELRIIFQEIYMLCPDKDCDTFIEEQQTIQETLDDLWLAINKKVQKYSSDSVSDANTSSAAKLNTSDVRLPKLELCSFTGENIEEWISFYDLFKASVDNNPNISKCHKLQYLKASCKKKALSIIESIPISDANYDIAIQLLEERYSNKRELTNALVRKMFNLPNVSDTAQAILHCVDVVNECVRSLRALKQEVSDFSEVLFVYVITEKLDKNIKFWWERTLKKDELGTLDNLLEFLKDHARTLQNSRNQSKDFRKFPQSKVTSLVSGKYVCILCKEDHYLHKCGRFLNLSVQKRIEYVKNHKLCFNCLNSEPHLVKNCRSVHKCKTCNLPHHTVLHFDRNPKSSEKENLIETSPLSPNADVSLPTNTETVTHSTTCTGQFSFPKGEGKRVLLCTAVIKVNDSTGKAIPCRALLDSGSEASFISEECVRKLNLCRKNTKIEVSCLGSYNTVTSGQVELNFMPHFESTSKFLTYAYVIPKVTSHVPNVSLPSNIADHFDDLVLADPMFYERKPIDILLGVNVFFTMLKGDIIKRGESMPFAVCSQLGWIISGNTLIDNSSLTTTYTVNNLQLSTNELVEKFWSLDSIPEVKHISSEDQECEEFFKATHFREQSGRYVVKLPFKASPSKLGNSKDLALQRFKSLEQKLLRSPVLNDMYKQFMKEYLELGHMKPVCSTESPSLLYYIPHHAVIKESSSTSKLRVVFNASSKSSSGISLNDILMIGPRIQQELFPILIKFRSYPLVVTADIMKMFRQILVNEEDRDFQRIFWRNSPSEPIQEFRLKTVTYGTASAPYLATRVLYQLAYDEQNNYPLAAKAVLQNFYVDDCLAGAQNKEECKSLVKELMQMLERGGFVLRKWSSNDLSVLENIPMGLRNDSESMKIQDDSSIKILGINWNPHEDYFNFSVFKSEEKSKYTKRDILSDLAKIFDPLGWLAPCIIYVKILIQDMWKFHLSWDEPVSDETANKWKAFRKDLPLIQKLKIPRFVLIPEMNYVDICAFCDSSEKGYCAVIYLRSVSRNLDIKISLLTSKTRVAPLKVQSLPRLELCAAVLLVDLLKVVLEHLEFPIRNVLAWTDSTIVLSWISSEPYRWLPFVANRVAKVQNTVSNVKWNHINGKLNPADSATRGLFPAELLSNELWWNGPSWLKCKEIPVSKTIPINEDELPEARKTLSFIVSESVKEFDIISKISSFSKLQRIFAWILRFSSNSKLTRLERNMSFLSSEELQSAKLCIIRIVQRVNFSKEIQCLEMGKSLPTNSSVISLCPFLDSNKVLRVGGRLKNAQLSENEKHPILLPSKHHLTKIIIRHFHEKYLHAAPELLLSLIRQQFWIIAARSVCRKIVRACVRCCRLRAQPASQIMADLPASRVIQSRPFHRVGLDFSGPFMIKYRAGRGQKSFKSYVCVFVCFVVKAVHLEIVEDLSTKAFLSVLKRFVARRGKPIEMHSDCGTNFKGAEKEISKYLLQCKQNPELHEYFASEEIEWKFNPPAAPHFGGLWESTVKSMKSHLKKTAGGSVLTFSEFQTLVTQVEACLNSRPLCPISSDPADLTALTPGHFLVGTSLTAIPEQDLSNSSLNHLDRWHVRQFIFQQFWKRWSREYLSQLQQRPKWRKSQRNVEVNDLVLIKEDNLPPLIWKLGRIIAVHPGLDNKVRVVTIKTGHGIIKRPVVKVCPLPIV